MIVAYALDLRRVSLHGIKEFVHRSNAIKLLSPLKLIMAVMRAIKTYSITKELSSALCLLSRAEATPFGTSKAITGSG
jgi:hypothetical protein